MRFRHLTLTSLTALLALAGCDAPSEEVSARLPRPVLYMVAEPDLERTSRFIGTVDARHSTTLAFRATGRMTARNVNVGDRVEAGDIVATLDPTSFDLQMRAVAADLAKAEAQYASALSNEERQRFLLKEKAISQAAYDSALRARDSAAASLERVKAEARRAEDQRGYAVLRAPHSGVISAVYAEPGEVVGLSRPAVALAQPDVREAVVDIPDSEQHLLKQGTRFVVHLHSAKPVSASGHVREVSPGSDAMTRTRRVRILLDSPPEEMRIGALVTAEPTLASERHYVLPASAVGERDGAPFVWLIDTETKVVLRHPITVVDRDAQQIVTTSLEPGQLVATAGVNSMEEGQTVRIAVGGNEP